MIVRKNEKSVLFFLILVLIVGQGCTEDNPTGPGDTTETTDSTLSAITILSPDHNSAVFGIVEIVTEVADSNNIKKVEFYINDILPEDGTDTTEVYSYSWNVSGLDKGTSHTIFVRAYNVNNDTTVSSIVTVTIGTGIISVPSSTYPTIQAGIDAANSGDTVLVSPGTYIENIDFNGKNIVVGSLFLTTGDSSYISQTVIDGDSSGTVVIFQNGVDSTAALKGFTITNGSSRFGGGILCFNNSSPTLSNLIVKGNKAEYGAGINCERNSNPLIENVTISGNVSSLYGGGIFLYTSSPRLNNVAIHENSAIWGGGFYSRTYSNPTLLNNGGGVMCEFDSNPYFTDVEITGNTAGWGSGVCLRYANPTFTDVLVSENTSSEVIAAAGIDCFNSNPILTDVKVIDNITGRGINIIYSNPILTDVTISGNDGGGIFFGNSNGSLTNVTVSRNSGTGIIIAKSSNPVLKNVTIDGNSAEDGAGLMISEIDTAELILKNVIITGNTALNNGGGIWLAYTSNLNLVNVTISGNTAFNDGGGIYVFLSDLNVMNTILWNNSPDEVFFSSHDDSVIFAFSDVEGGEEGIVTIRNTTVLWGEGSIDLDPIFVDPGNNDFHLQAGSPSIDAGNPDPKYNDTDGSRNDMGVYGGPSGNW